MPRANDEIKDWIVRLPEARHAAIVLCFREAARMLPFLASEYRYSARKANKITDHLVLAAFRSLFLTWVNARYKHLNDVLRSSTDSSKAFIQAAPTDGRAAKTLRKTLASANGACTGSAPVAASYAARMAFTAGVEAFGGDRRLLENGMSEDELISVPLWNAGAGNNRVDWESLKYTMLKHGPHWIVWATWYDAIFNGEKPWHGDDRVLDSLSLEIAKIPTSLWKAGGDVVNHSIINAFGRHNIDILGCVDDETSSGAPIQSIKKAQSIGDLSILKSAEFGMLNQYHSIFLSHSNVDKPFARQLRDDLLSAGVPRVWIDEAEIKIGDSLIEKISEGLRLCRYVGVLLSPRSIGSNWVKRELEVALTREIESGVISVLPLVYEKCELPIFLQGKLYADFMSSDKYDYSLARLLERLKK